MIDGEGVHGAFTANPLKRYVSRETSVANGIRRMLPTAAGTAPLYPQLAVGTRTPEIDFVGGRRGALATRRTAPAPRPSAGTSPADDPSRRLPRLDGWREEFVVRVVDDGGAGLARAPQIAFGRPVEVVTGRLVRQLSVVDR